MIHFARCITADPAAIREVGQPSLKLLLSKNMVAALTRLSVLLNERSNLWVCFFPLPATRARFFLVAVFPRARITELPFTFPLTPLLQLFFGTLCAPRLRLSPSPHRIFPVLPEILLFKALWILRALALHVLCATWFTSGVARSVSLVLQRKVFDAQVALAATANHHDII